MPSRPSWGASSKHAASHFNPLSLRGSRRTSGNFSRASRTVVSRRSSSTCSSAWKRSSAQGGSPWNLTDLHRTAGMPTWDFAAIVYVLNFSAALLSARLFFQAYKIPSGAMEPTLLIGDHIMVDKRARTPHRGDVIVFVFPPDPTKDFVKRVIAVGGDTVEVRKGLVYLNGQQMPDPHARFEVAPKDRSPASPRDNFGPVTVPSAKIFVLGDTATVATTVVFGASLTKRRCKAGYFTYTAVGRRQQRRQACALAANRDARAVNRSQGRSFIGLDVHKLLCWMGFPLGPVLAVIVSSPSFTGICAGLGRGPECLRMQTRFRKGLTNGTLLSCSREMRRKPTEAERTLWYRLRRANLGVRFR